MSIALATDRLSCHGTASPLLYVFSLLGEMEAHEEHLLEACSKLHALWLPY